MLSNVINLKYKSVLTYWIALYITGDDAIYFQSFEIEYVSK